MEKRLTLSVVTPEDAEITLTCDAVRFSVRDDTKTEDGGLYGIRPGHTTALFSLLPGPVPASLDGKVIFSGRTDKGFVMTEHDTVSVVTDHFTKA